MEKIASFWVSTTPHYVVLDEDNNLRFITTKLEEAEAEKNYLNVAYADYNMRFYVYELIDGLYMQDKIAHPRNN